MQLAARWMQYLSRFVDTLLLARACSILPTFTVSTLSSLPVRPGRGICSSQSCPDWARIRSRPGRRAIRPESVRSTGRGRRRDDSSRRLSVLKRLNTSSITSGGMPRPWSLTLRMISSPRRSADKTYRLARLREADRVREQIEQNLADALAVGDEGADFVRGLDLEMDRGFSEPVLHAFAQRD